MGGNGGKKARRSAASGALPATGATPTNSGGGACGGGNPDGPNKKKAKLDFSKYKNNTGDAVRTLMANAPTSNIPVQFNWNWTSGLGGDVIWRNYGRRTDERRTFIYLTWPQRGPGS